MMVVTMASVFTGFLLFGGAFASYMYRKPRALTIGLFVASLCLITLVPVILAVFYAATTTG